MGTKWKNRVVLGVWVLLFTFGLSGILYMFTYGSSYVHRDYFQTPAFQSELAHFAEVLRDYELNDMSLNEAKSAIKVSEDEIIEYRLQAGSLANQIANVRAEFENLIQEALAINNPEAADVYIAERDKRVEEIITGFNSDEYIKAKVINEKEQALNAILQSRERNRSEYLRYEDTFQYYFKNSATGKVYTNLGNAMDESAKDEMIAREKLFITSYSIPGLETTYYSLPGHYGQIAVSKFLSPSNALMIQYDSYKQKQILLLIFTLASIGALILCFNFRVGKVIPARFESWSSHYNRLPIDLRAIVFIVSGVGAVTYLFLINEGIYYDIENLFVYFWDIVSSLVIGSIIWGLTLIQGRFLATELKEKENVKAAWEKSLLKRAGQRVNTLYNKAKLSLRDAFLNKSLGIQLLIMLLAIFALGFAASIIIFDPIYLLFYMIPLVLIGIPIVMIVIKSIGYFNLILIKTNEMAAGNLGQDLSVSGKSVLALLAGNINTLKKGVKTSQTEQAKSERLKTELITNVSHDLRTPLTSIITYTDLLKKEDISDEDRAAYLEIIDRKSKRLKVLIDDLFEVSKMASGNIDLALEKVDLVQLVQQALAEHDNTIDASNLQFRVTYTELPIYAHVDGKKLWRVFDNLIENVLKYSLDNSRVYIMVGTNDNQAIITFKNVSKFELSENSDELFERFKRGDTSRQTEGSGLGLAIVKSIVDLHEGSLDIETEGDLFKVSISLKLVRDDH